MYWLRCMYNAQWKHIQVTFYSLTIVLCIHIFYVHCFVATVHLKYWLKYIWCALGRGSYMYFWMHFSHYNVIDAMYIRCVQNLLTMYILKYISMSSGMHIVSIAMYVQCTMNAHELYILFPYECTLNAHFNVHLFFATLHLKYW